MFIWFYLVQLYGSTIWLKKLDQTIGFVLHPSLQLSYLNCWLKQGSTNRDFDGQWSTWIWLPGWWFQPLWQILISWGVTPIFMESHKSHVPNHQPGMVSVEERNHACRDGVSAGASRLALPLSPGSATPPNQPASKHTKRYGQLAVYQRKWFKIYFHDARSMYICMDLLENIYIYEYIPVLKLVFHIFPRSAVFYSHEHQLRKPWEKSRPKVTIFSAQQNMNKSLNIVNP